MSLSTRVEEMLSPGGRLSGHWPHFEPRPGQVALARDIAETIERGGVLLAEAPTGVGKSLAYLLPAVLHALEREQRVVIATCTRSLQDQLFERDLPQVLEVLGASLPCARLKGKQNYVCPVALERGDGASDAEREVLDALRVWAVEDPAGDLDRFPAGDGETFARLRGRLGADPHACTAHTCRRARECAWVRARRTAAQARLVVVNHALLAAAGEAEGLLPEFDVLIVDEAHRLEGVLLAQLERRVSRNRVEELLRSLGSGRRGGVGLLSRLSAATSPLLERANESDDTLGALARRVGETRASTERLFERLAGERPREHGAAADEAGPASAAEPDPRYARRVRHRSQLELLGRELDDLDQVLGACAEFESALRRLAAPLMAGGPRLEALGAEAEQAAGRFGDLGRDLEALTSAENPDWVYWRTLGASRAELHGSPVHAGDHARRIVASRARAVVLTSATLSAGGSFDFIAERLGLGETRGAPYTTGVYPTPFELARQMTTFVHEGRGDESETVARIVADLATTTGRNVLALFTAHERMRRAHARLARLLPPGTALLCQDLDGTAARVAERFRAERGAVLLGVQSLWEGVDFPGEALEVLVVAKLPFAVPDDPLVESRGERLREQGLEPFMADAVPEAVLRFRQGIGRLIRRADDRGVLVVCDPRLATASYRRAFLEALPVPPRREREPAVLARAAAQFLIDDVTVEET